MNTFCKNRYRRFRPPVPTELGQSPGRAASTPVSCRPLAFSALFRVLLAVMTVIASPAAGEEKPANLNVIGAIRISADALTVPGGTENYAEFKGNVHASGDRFDITADQLKIFYQPSSEKTGNDITSGNSLTRIIASGNVVITSGEKIAKTEEAVYDKAQQTIILTGEKSMVLQNNSYIAGKRIIMHLDSETVMVESGEGKRVEAFIEPRDMKKDN